MTELVRVAVPSRQQLQEELRSEQEENLFLRESLADQQLMLEDRGWRGLVQGIADEFTVEGRRHVSAVCRSMAISNPLLKKGLNTRIGYIWGQGVEIRAAAAGSDENAAEQDVDSVVQAFIDDNKKSLTASQAQEELERALGTDGNVFLCGFTNPLNGRVQVRSTPANEITDIITNPEDRDEPWYYVRTYVERVFEPGTVAGTTRTRGQTKTVVHPALGYVPSPVRINNLNGAEVRWDAPILHVPVNRLDGWLWGVPDLYASVAWARMYRDFLVDWAGLTKALSKIAYQATGDTKSKAQKAATALAATTDAAGQTAVGGPGTHLEAVSKSGATIDAQSGKPLAGMVAAGLGLPVTVLLADPGVTGARAVAETLDLPTILEMAMRRLLWQAALTRYCQYAIEQAVIAPRGELKGTLSTDGWGRRQVVLAGDTEDTIEVDWPPIANIDPVQLVTAIAAADGTGKMPPLVTVRLLLSALGVKDIDEALKDVTDDQGNFIEPLVTAAQAAVDRHRQGNDPAGAA